MLCPPPATSLRELSDGKNRAELFLISNEILPHFCHAQPGLGRHVLIITKHSTERWEKILCPKLHANWGGKYIVNKNTKDCKNSLIVWSFKMFQNQGNCQHKIFWIEAKNSAEKDNGIAMLCRRINLHKMWQPSVSYDFTLWWMSSELRRHALLAGRCDEVAMQLYKPWDWNTGGLSLMSWMKTVTGR